MNIPLVLQKIRPGAEWSLKGDEYDGLEWLDAVQTKPTIQDLEDAWAKMQDGVPETVSMLALNLAIIEAGLEQEVLNAISAISDEKERRSFTVWWTRPSTVKRNHPTVASLAEAIGQTDEQIDAVFIAAKLLESTL